jgi:FKBP-type peptidyl-prolyl cis-trans isomerase
MKHQRSLPYLFAAVAALLPLAPAGALDPSLAPPPEAETRPSGLITQVLAEGAGNRHPRAENRVQVHFTGRRLDGTLFMDSHAQPQVPILEPTRVVPGWREGLLLMVEGEKRRLWIPPNLSSAKESEIVVFDVELMRILDPVPAQGEFMRIPTDAATTESGARSRLLRPGTGESKPDQDSVFLVEYTGWTRDGMIFDSTDRRGRATGFVLSKVMPAFGECLLLMIEGEKRRCWISEDLAQANWIGSPKGDLVFDIELIKIMDGKEVLGQAEPVSQ